MLSEGLEHIPNAVIIAAAVVTAVGIIWRKVFVPIRGWFRQFKAWMHRVEESMVWVEAQMKPNGGSSLVDKVNTLLQHDLERDKAGRRYGPAADDEGDAA